MRASTPSPQRDAGFTLIEMMVVISILALAMAIVPAITSGISGSRLRAAADTLVAVLREVHSEAIRRDTPESVAFNLAERSFVTQLRRGPQRLPRIVSRLEVTPARRVGPAGSVAIEFQPDGSATPARIVLFSGDRRMTIRIDWLTGRVQQDG